MNTSPEFHPLISMGRGLRKAALPVSALALTLIAAPTFAANLTWNGVTNGIWATSTNWSPNATPGSSDDLTILGPVNVSGALTINIDAAAFANSLNLTNSATTNLTNTTSGSNKTLTIGAGGITTYNGTLNIGSTTLNQNVNVVLGASQTWNVGAGSMTVTNVISDGGSGFGITKSGSGIGTSTLTLAGANTYTGGTAVTTGTLTLTGSINSSSALTLGGGGLGAITFNYTPTTAGSTQTFASTTLNSGFSTVANATATNVVNLGAITRNAGSILNVSSLTGTTNTSSAVDSTGILGTGITTGTTTTLKYAAGGSGGAITGYAGGTAAAAPANVTDTTGAVNYDLATSAGGTLGTGASFNTLRYTGGAGTVAGNFTANGLMNAGSGAVTYSGNVTIGANKELVIVGNNQATTFSGVIADNGGGASTVIYGGPSANTLNLNGVNTYTGNTTIGQGNLTIGGAGQLNSGNYAGNIFQANGVFTYNSTANQTLSGNITGGGGLTKFIATSTLSLSGTNALGGNLLLSAGRINVTAGTTNFGAPSGGNFSQIGNAASTTGTLNVAPGATFGYVGISGGNIGANTLASGVVYNAGTFNQTATAANGSGIYLGNQPSSYGYLYNTGTATISGRMYVGRVDAPASAGSAGLLDIAGGTVTVSGTNMAVGTNTGAGSQGSFLLNTNNNSSGTARPSTGYAGVNVHGGTLTLGQAQTFQINTGANYYTSINVTGSGSKIATTGAAGFNLNFTSDATNTTTLALHNGGSLETSLISNTGSSSNAYLSFDNGKLKATAADATGLIQSGVTTYIQSGGATIDTNGFNTTIATPLQAPSGNGVTSIALGGTATGYAGAPIVKIVGDGTGAAAIANFDPATGTVTGITVTAAGSGYTSAPTITLVGGNGGSTGVGVGTATGTASIGAVTSGGLTKTGTGSLTLSASNTYTGGTVINNGTLALTGTGDINASSGVTVNAGGTLSQGSSVALTAPVAFNGGTVRGSSTIASLTANGGTIANGTGGTDTSALTITNLTFTGSTALSFTTSDAAASSPLLTSTSITKAGTLTINALNTAGIWTTGTTYSLINGAISGSGTFAVGTISGLGTRQTATLQLTGSSVGLQIGGVVPVWSGGGNGQWVSAVQSPKNWVAQGTINPTDYQNGDVVVFDDNATGTTNVSISTANVTPNNVQFSNSSQNYSIGGTFGIAGTTGVSKSGSGTLTLSAPSSYSGGTTLNDGQLNINYGTVADTTHSAIGTGPLTVNAGVSGPVVIDNTSGSAVTLGTNNAQVWNDDVTFGGTNNLNMGTGAITMAAARTVTVNGAAPVTLGGVISGTGFGLTKAGSGTLVLAGANNYTGATAVNGGTLVLAGANTYTGATTVNGGTLRVSGTINAANTANVGQISVGSVGGSTGIIDVVSGGTINATRTVVPSISLGNAAGADGLLMVATGATVNATSEIWLGTQANANGAITMTGGTVTSGSWLPVGRSGNGILNMSGGTINVNSNNFTHGSFAGAYGVTNFSGGTINTTGGFLVAEAGTGVFNISGSAALNISGAAGLYLGNGAGVGIVNVGGGTITTPLVQKGAGTGTLNFHGGTIKPSVDSATFMQTLTNAYVYSEGGTIDSNGHAITIGQALLAPSGSGVTGISVTDGGSGYAYAPIIQLTGGAGTGATAVANVTGGVITGFTITNPGSGYSPSDTLTATIVGGGTTTPATVGTVTLGGNTSGGLTFIGSGINSSTTLSGVSTYTGATNVNSGKVLVTGSISSPVNIASGATLGGTGTIGGLVTPAIGGIIAPGLTGAIGKLTVGSLTLNTGSIINTEFTDPSTYDTLAISTPGGLTINGGGYNLYNTGGTTAYATNGQYNLISYSGGLTGSASNLTVINGQSGKTYTFGATGSNIILTISPNGVVANNWNVDSDGNWTDGTKWSLGTAPNGSAQFASFGSVITAPRTVTLNLDQTVGTVAFNNTNTYTIAGSNTLTLDNGTDAPQITDSNGNHIINANLAIAGSNAAQINTFNASDTLTIGGVISGTAGLQKLGSGTLVLSGVNTYAGANSVSSGTLRLSGSGTLGNTANPVTINSTGVLDLGGTTQTTGAVTLNDGSVTNGTIAPASVSATGTGSPTVSAVISGAGALTVNKTGGMLTLTGANTYTGGTTITAGTLQLGNGTTDGTLTGDIVNNGTLLENIVGTPTYSGNISGTGALNKTGTGTLTLGGTNTYTGATTVNAGTLALSGTYTGGGALTVNAGATFTGSSSGTNTLGNFLVTGASSAATLTSGTYNVASTSGGGVANTRINNGGSLTVNGATLNITGAGAWFPIGDTAATTSTVTLNSGVINVSNDFGAEVGRIGTGVLNINGGTFTVNDTNSIGLVIGDQVTAQSGTVNLNGGVLAVRLLLSKNGTNALNFNGGTLQATSTNSGATFWASSSTLTANVRNNGGTIDNNGTSIKIGQALVHSTIGGDNDTDGGMKFTGAGTTTLTGANTFTGATQVNGGTLLLASTGSLDGSISLGVASGATLELDNNVSLNDTITLSLVSGATLNLNFALGTDETIGVLVLNGTTAPAGTYDAAALAGLGGASGITFTGSGALTVAAVPEPSVFGLLGLGLASVLFLRRRRC